MNLAGQRFGRLLVTHQARHSTDGDVSWSCRCNCGDTAIIKARSLRNGHTKSCGCLRSEIARAAMTARRAAA